MQAPEAKIQSGVAAAGVRLEREGRPEAAGKSPGVTAGSREAPRAARALCCALRAPGDGEEFGDLSEQPDTRGHLSPPPRQATPPGAGRGAGGGGGGDLAPRSGTQIWPGRPGSWKRQRAQFRAGEDGGAAADAPGRLQTPGCSAPAGGAGRFFRGSFLGTGSGPGQVRSRDS